MQSDPIIDELRASRDRLAERFDHDLRRIFEDLRDCQRRSGRQVVTRPPKRPLPAAGS